MEFKMEYEMEYKMKSDITQEINDKINVRKRNIYNKHHLHTVHNLHDKYNGHRKRSCRLSALSLSAVLFLGGFGAFGPVDRVHASQPSAGAAESVQFPDGSIPAFPGAEGGGMYATGGRGGDVYVVRNLNDSGEGSLRHGINTAPESGRIIVFDVGGTIHLESPLSFKNKSNITIAGQTAPGDGVTIAGYDTNISNSKNIIIRFMRFRVGTENLLKGGDSMDALWGRDNDTFIIDHCSFSWNTDETLSTYRGKNGTVQWCIISESLTVSGHSKGRHGYGGIFGGNNTVFQYNLLADHTSRNPRIGGGSMTDPTSERSFATLQVSNNVLYNHGYLPCYGGGFAYTNYINNYVQGGPGTRESLKDILIYVGEKNKTGGFYVNGNILAGNERITNDNRAGIKEDAPDYVSAEPYAPTEDAANPKAFDVTLVSAADCYEPVLNGAGATFPLRDAVDARVVAQVRSNTGFYINTPDEVGGYPARVVTAADIGRTDTDGDGIPDAWEISHGLNPQDAGDSRLPASLDAGSPNYGYAWIEVYCSELVSEVVKSGCLAPNPEVGIDLENNTLIDEGEDVTVTAEAFAKNGGSIARVEFFNGDQVVGAADKAPYSYTYTGLKDGTYNISVRAYDNEGNATQSNTSKLHVNSTAGTGDWTGKDVGRPGVAGTASLTDGVLTVKGAGKLGRSEGSVEGSPLNNAASDDFQFVYQKMEGDGELTAKLDSYLAVDCHTFNGLMFRESLEEDAAAAALGLTLTKIWDGNITTWTAFMVKRTAAGGNMSTIGSSIDSYASALKADIPVVSNLGFKSGDTFRGIWLKLNRNGDVFTGSISNDGQTWKPVGEVTVKMPETVYVGFAVEAGKAANLLENYATAQFSNIALYTDFRSIAYELEDVEYTGADQFASGEDISVTLSPAKGYLLPETVEVLVGGRAAEVSYDREKGVIALKNPAEDVVIRARGIKRTVVPVICEEVDPENLLTVQAEDGRLILAQNAQEGSTSTGVPGGDYQEAENESWILFPEVDRPHKMSLKLTVSKVLDAGGHDNTGVFVGAFDVSEGRQAFCALGFRPCAKAGEAVSKFWTKTDKTGNGGIKRALEMNMVYSVEFSYDEKGQYAVSWESESGSKGSETFKAGESYLKNGDIVRYGIGLIGAEAVITDLKFMDYEDNVLYDQNAAQTLEAMVKVQGEDGGQGTGALGEDDGKDKNGEEGENEAGSEDGEENGSGGSENGSWKLVAIVTGALLAVIGAGIWIYLYPRGKGGTKAE